MFPQNIKFVNTLFKIIIISSWFRFSRSFKPYIPGNYKSPEIWLASFQQTDSFENVIADHQFRHASSFENDNISKFNKTDYIIQDDTRQVVFICDAKYPVMWYVPHIKQVVNLPFEMFIIDTERKADFLKQVPQNKYFRTSLTIRFDEYIRDVFSVNFTCGLPTANEIQVNQLSEHKSSSIYLYYSGSQQVIEKFDNTIEISVGENYAHETIAIPCRPALPTISIKLEKEVQIPYKNDEPDTKKRIWKKIYNFTFDPKYGFTVDKNRKESVFGLYRCSISELEESSDDTKDEENVLVNVTLDTSKLPKPTIQDVEFVPSLNLKGNAFLKYGNRVFGRNIPPRHFQTLSFQEADLWCCSGVNNDRPVIYKRTCTNPLQCEILKKSMTFNVWFDNEYGFNYVNYRHSSSDPEDCVSTAFYDQDSVVFCKGQNVEFGDHFIKLFNDDLFPITKIKDQGNRLEVWTFEPESSKAAANITRRMFLSVGQPIEKYHGYQYDRQVFDFTRSRSSEPQYVDISVDYLDDDEQHFRNINIGIAKRMKSQLVSEYSRDYFYKGELLIPICLGWLSFYSRGAYVRILFANGTSTILNVKEEEEPSKYVMYFREGLNMDRNYFIGNLVEYKFGKQVLAHENMTAFECWMPQWNSEKWDKLEYKLRILEPTKPNFIGDASEDSNVYFDLGSDNQTLEWRVLGGSPEPKVEVTVDGKEMYNGSINDLDKFYFESYHVFDKFNLTLEYENGTDNLNGTTEVVSLKLLFAQVTHELQGVYQCKVTNVGGTVTQSFKVIVLEKRSIGLAHIITITVSVLVITIFAGLIGKFWRFKQSQRRSE